MTPVPVAAAVMSCVSPHSVVNVKLYTLTYGLVKLAINLLPIADKFRAVGCLLERWWYIVIPIYTADREICDVLYKKTGGYNTPSRQSKRYNILCMTMLCMLLLTASC